MNVPRVSVVMPTFNERRFIRDSIDSLLAQDYDHLCEILVVDGQSTDGTREIAEQLPAPVRLVDNPRRSAAAALNVGLAEVMGDVYLRADAHTLYSSDYVSRCVEVLIETGADNAGGPMRPVGITMFGRAVAAVTSTPLGVGPGLFHYGTTRQEVDTVYLGCWWVNTLRELGGFDEESLQWGAEDHELNFRLRQRGGRVVLDPSIVSWYFPRESPQALARQYFNYGVGKSSTLLKHGRLPSWRPLAPAALVAATAIAGLMARGPLRIVVPTLHAALAAATALRTAAAPDVAPHRAFNAIQLMHWSYGAGFWVGLVRGLSGRRFQSQPHRR